MLATTIIDFDDSFTYNIATELLALGKQYSTDVRIEVVNKKDAIKYLHNINLKENDKMILVYGPGPGHPDEYQEFYPILERLFRKKNIFHLGICLGHQMIWKIKGYDIVASNRPTHGQRVKIRIPRWERYFNNSDWGKEVYVQRYNSLTVNVKEKNECLPGNKFYFKDGECFAGCFKRGLTFQFHPESVGTSCPGLFLRSSMDFLYYN